MGTGMGNIFSTIFNLATKDENKAIKLIGSLSILNPAI